MLSWIFLDALIDFKVLLAFASSRLLGQNVDHAYYTSKIYGPGDRAGRELWVDVEEMGEEWKGRGFLSSAHRQAEVSVCSQQSSTALPGPSASTLCPTPLNLDCHCHSSSEVLFLLLTC